MKKSSEFRPFDGLRLFLTALEDTINKIDFWTNIRLNMPTFSIRIYLITVIRFSKIHFNVRCYIDRISSFGLRVMSSSELSLLVNVNMRIGCFDSSFNLA
jgi:hypothetical protein